MQPNIETLLMGVGNAIDVCHAACSDLGIVNAKRQGIDDSVRWMLDGIERGGNERKAITLSVIALLNKINAGGGSLWYLSSEGAICRETFPNGVLVGIVERLLL